MGFEAHEMKVHTISFDFMILLSFIVHCDSEPTGSEWQDYSKDIM